MVIKKWNIDELTTKARLFIPDLEFVKRTLHTVDERCPNCKQRRSYIDMVYITMYDSPMAACWHCLPEFKERNNINLPTSLMLNESEEYARQLAKAINPKQWRVKLRKGQTDEYVRGMVSAGLAKVIQDNWYDAECQGKYSREATVTPGTYIVKRGRCSFTNKKTYKKYFSSLGVVCNKCLITKPDGLPYMQDLLDLKQKQRCICEGMRYAAWLARWDHRLFMTPFDLEDSGDDPWRIKWADWRPELYADTRHTDAWEFKNGPHVRAKERKYVF